jgi:hypothetical protein
MALLKVLTATGMFKGIPRSVQLFITPMLLISLGLHAAVLFMPLPAPPKEAQTPKPKSIKITKIPILRASPKPLARQLKQQKTQGQNVPSPIPQKGIVLPRNPKKAPTVAKAPTKPEPTPSAPASDTPNSGDVNWRDLPTYTKNIQPCDGATGCIQTGDTFDAVTKHFESYLSSKKIKFFKEKPKISYEGQYTNYKVLNKKGEAQFLSIFSNGENTKYVWADKIALEVDIVTPTPTPTDLATLIKQLPTQFVDPSKTKLSPDRFPDVAVTKFYIDKDTPIFGFKNAPADAPVIVSLNPTETSQTFLEKLSALNYSANLIAAGYADGTLYEITKSDQPKPLYITIIPTKQDDGSIVALWLDMPK